MGHISNYIDEALMHQPEPIKTGYKFLDEMIGGYYPGEVTTIGGCEDSGKSAFVITQLNYITVDQKIPTLLVLDNMSLDVFIALMASYYCCITVKDIHSVLYSPIYRSSIDQYLNKLREAPLYIIETHPQSPEKLDYDMIEKVVKENGIRIVVYDEITGWWPSHENTIGYKLKRLALKWNIPIIVALCIWNDYHEERGVYLSLLDFNKYAGYHGTDVVLCLTDHEKNAVYCDEHGQNLRGKVEIAILKYKGLTKKQFFQINRNALYKRRETLEEQKKVFLEQKLGDDLIVKKMLEQFDLDIKEGIAEEDDE